MHVHFRPVISIKASMRVGCSSSGKEPESQVTARLVERVGMRA